MAFKFKLQTLALAYNELASGKEGFRVPTCLKIKTLYEGA